MRQILSSAGILVLLTLFSISDFDLGSFPDASDTVANFNDGSQYDCLEFELPDRVLDGSDGSCVAAAMIMQQALKRYNVNCLYITNEGWIPTAKNPVSAQWVQYLVAQDGGYGDSNWDEFKLPDKGGD